ncbi:MAG: glycosyltransferase [Candidatus Bathyarchaeia archaeon]
MMRKHIGILMYQTSKSKGQELVAQRMVREFIKLGHKAYLITSVFHDGEKVVIPENLAKRGGYICAEDAELQIPIIRVESYIAKWPPRRIVFRDFISTLEKIVDEFKLDVLITHSTLWNGPEEVAKFVEWRRYMKDIGGYEDPLVFCQMSHFQEPTPKRYSLTERSFRTAWNRLTLPQIFSTANLIIVVTPLEKEAKVKMGANPEKCFLFPGGVDDEVFLRYANVDVRGFVKGLGISENAKIVSFLGSLEERKNPAGFLRVAEKLQERKDIHFLLAGKGNSAYAEKVIQTAQTLPNVTYLGEITEREKVLLIKASRINLILSQLEALGLSQMEFMYQGVPVVTSATGGQKWLIRHGVEGIHVKGPGDVEGAAAAIERLVDNQGVWSELSENAKKRAMDFAVSNLTADLNKALNKELLKERGLNEIPSEARSTLSAPENVLKSWSSGSWGVIATGKRLFIKRGVLSRKVTEIPYTNISSIEYMRRYSWKTLLLGAAFSAFLFALPFMGPVFSRTLVSRITEIFQSIIPQALLESVAARAFVDLLPMMPLLIALAIFAFQARTGFTLRSPGIGNLYLPRKFREAIAFIRNMQDNEQGKNARSRSATRKEEKDDSARDSQNEVGTLLETSSAEPT